MKKAVVKIGSSQYVVSEGSQISVNLLETDGKKFATPALLVVDGDKTTVGAPEVSGVKVEFLVVEADTKGDKVTAIRYKAKKRVLKVRGHRQRLTTLKVSKIA